MLVLFESTVCYQRLQSLQYLRDMLRDPYAVCIFRNGHWRGGSTAQLLPGDLVSLGAAEALHLPRRRRAEVKSDQVVPCDVLLLRGDCIVNEAMLTGESVPQRKEALPPDDDDAGNDDDDDDDDEGEGVYGDDIGGSAKKRKKKRGQSCT